MNNNIFSKACEIYSIIDDDVNTFKYIDVDNQIDGIIYYVTKYIFNNETNNWNNNLNNDLNIDNFIKKIYENCHYVYKNIDYPYDKGESEMIYIEERLEAQTFEMIQSVIKDFYEYFNK